MHYLICHTEFIIGSMDTVCMVDVICQRSISPICHGHKHSMEKCSLPSHVPSDCEHWYKITRRIRFLLKLTSYYEYKRKHMVEWSFCLRFVKHIDSLFVFPWFSLLNNHINSSHCNDDIMSALASQITSLTTVCSTVYSRRGSKKTSKLRVTGLCAGNSPVTVEFPALRASNMKNVSIWSRYHVLDTSQMLQLLSTGVA